MPVSKIVSTCIFMCVIISNTIQAQTSLNMQLLAHYNDTSLVKHNTQIWNDVMGWYDSVKQKEYMISGTTDSIYFFDVSNPDTIQLLFRFFGTNRNCTNRDYYTYKHYLYAVSDQCDNFGNLQIFDLQHLPDSIVKVYESDTLGGLTHTIFIEEKSARMYMMLNKIINHQTSEIVRSPMDIISLVNPTLPVRIGRLVFPSPYEGARVHEAYVRNDTAYCSSENAGLFIFDVRDASQPNLISAITPPYPQNGYNHSSWLDSSGRYLLFTDESPEGLGIKIYDLKDIYNPRIVGTPFKEAGSPHNSYWMGRYAYTSAYWGGVQIYDLNKVDSPVIGAYYDTYPQTFSDGYHGCWGVWPYLPSGIILASDMENGLFIFRTTEHLAINEKQLTQLFINTYPNPFENEFQITIPTKKPEQTNLTVYNLYGKIVHQEKIELESGANTFNINLAIPSGIYIIKVVASEYIYTTRVIKK